MADPIVGLELVKVQPRVDFAPDEFRAQIQAWGHRFRWERATRCPCALKYEDSYDPTYTRPVRAGRADCAGCKGVGYLYGAVQDVKALVNDSSSDKRFLQAFGEMAFGSVRLSLLPEHLPAWRDRFVDLDGARIYQDPPRQREAGVEQPTYPILTRNMLVGSALDPTVAQRRDIGVTILRKATSEGVLVSDELVEGVDFLVTDEGAIEFIDASAGVGPPAVGESYSVTYTCRPTYIVRSHPHLYRHTYVARKPFLNAVDGYKGDWDPGDEAFPDDATIVAGDYFEVVGDGTVDGVAFEADDVLVARINAPSSELAGDWVRVSNSDEPLPAELVPMTVLAMCWLEDLGDPFARSGLP